MIEVYVGYGVMAVVIAVLLLERRADKRDTQAVRDSLLDRIMANTYQQYVDTQTKVQEIAARTGGKVEVITVEELEKRIGVENYGSGGGIPV